MTSPHPILIAGGGIGGLATALVLARDGHAVTVLEQAASFGEIGAGIQLGPNIFKMFAWLGLTDVVSKVSFFPPGLGMNDVRTGEKVVRVPLGDVSRATYGFPYGVIYRADLHQVFLDACRDLPNITLRTDAKLESFEQTADSVRVRLANGETLPGVALIGADGLWSKVREAVVGDGKPRVSGHIAYRAVLKREDVPAHLWSDDVLLWGGEKTHLVHYPLRRGELFNLVAVFHSSKYDEGWNTFGDPAELTERFRDACPQVRELLGKIETWKMWVLCDREPVKNWTDRRVTLLGDAAHPMLQYLAQGAGQAIEDAVVLREALRFARGDVPLAFQKYQQARYLRTGRVQLTARFYGDIYHAAGVQRELRNQLFQSGNESAGFAGLKWMYDGIEPSKLFQ
ncbi:MULTISPECIES: 3-hydroxybenzoate 6-monooxygenase [unclassified Polaromonas]|uniref:3-hydroxybenzoate 6-monooxygenase n=1 Tax=unclassified Polaromonas TaxID=2638319 RepID=UPI0025EFC371|nr:MULTISPECIES: 3-hydroxybenzoate 6-monooxygenase [unclassified Polaromonas]HQS01140.1 3-hydroxybenzoate 6-monooxygenase [Polaromonas sp.]HQS42270.1 3-hydroxybenzoate 6-monooxygenase [Polaromonas sp.]HQS85719.1 3-hydroxybenzoate 6-monooxygenase [Polaromonas sp.]HQT05603.1 3-hydroxybenzoate 6-monooxygenase [Polaromonas sp.]